MYLHAKAYRTCLPLLLVAAAAAPTAHAGNSSTNTGGRPAELRSQVEALSITPSTGGNSTKRNRMPTSRAVSTDSLYGDYLGLGSGQETAGAATLIVLTSKASQDHISTLTEDLTIMSRIFDRALRDTGLRSENDDIFVRYFVTSGRGRRSTSLFAERPARTESIYVQGYGPLFLIAVDFPLLPPPESPRPSEPNGPTDPLWNQVARQVAGHGPAADAPGIAPQIEYRPEKVRSLRATLTEALRHAANIRGLSQAPQLTVVVRTVEAQSRDDMPLYVDMMYSKEDMYGVTTSPTPTEGSVLAIRAATQDIDAFASGSLSLAEFEKRIAFTQY